MTRRAAFAVAFSLILVFLVVPASGQPAPPAASERVEKDTPRATPGGATFTVPAGWTMTTKGSMVVLDPPEPDSHVAIVDVKAKDADAAVAAGWAAYQPDFKRPLKISLPQAARNGWEERKSYQYETSPNERAVVTAMAWRAGDSWAVILVDGSEPTFEKRGAPLGLALQSLRPKGYSRESFAGKKAHPLDEKRLAILKDFVAAGMKTLDTPGVGLAFLDGGKTVWAGGLGVKELGKPGPGRRRHALHRRVEHEGADDASPRRAGGRGEDPLGPARHGALPRLQAGERGDDEAGAGEAPHLRVHGDAAAGPRVAPRVQARDARVGAEAPRLDAADEPLRGGLPVQQPDGGRRRVHRRREGRARKGVGGRLRRGDADEGLRAARDDDDDVRLREGPEGGRRAAARRRRGREGDPGADGPQLLGRPGPPGGRRLDERAGALEVRRDGAGEGAAPERQAARLGGEPPRAVQAERHRRRGRDVRDGPDGRHAVRHPGGPPRRRPRRVPQRHDLAPGARSRAP